MHAASPPSSAAHSRYTQQPPPSAISSPAPSAYSQTHTPAASTSTLPLPRQRDSRIPSQPHAPSLQQQLFGQGVPSGGILDRPLNRTKGAEVALPAFAFLLAEMISYSQSRVDSVDDLEKR